MNKEIEILDGRSDSYTCGHPVGFNMYTAIETAEYYAKYLFTFVQTFKAQNKTIIIWCTGSSGSILSALTVKSYIEKYDSMVDISVKHLKKKGETSHYNNSSYTHSLNDFNVVIDDFCATGATIENIVKEVDRIIKNHYNYSPKKYEGKKLFDCLIVRKACNYYNYGENMDDVDENHFKGVLASDSETFHVLNDFNELVEKAK